MLGGVLNESSLRYAADTESGDLSSKIHRHHTPTFSGTVPRCVAAKRFAAALKVHSWNRNRALVRQRQDSGRRISIRSERRQTLDALAMALIAYCDYSPESDYLFEVFASVEQLASVTGQRHLCDSGRVTYDPTLNALKQLADAQLIIVQHGHDPDTRQQKAMRIWLRPEFFQSIGFTLLEVRQMLRNFRKYMERTGYRETAKSRYAEHVMRIARSNVASIDDRHALKALLKKLKYLVLGDAEKEAEKRHIEQATKQKLAATRKTQREDDPLRELRARWQAVAATGTVSNTVIEMAVLKEHPDVQNHSIQFYTLCLARKSG